jgi:hypothetical protein
MLEQRYAKDPGYIGLPAIASATCQWGDSGSNFRITPLAFTSRLSNQYVELLTVDLHDLISDDLKPPPTIFVLIVEWIR